jgi:hypothetical protein
MLTTHSRRFTYTVFFGCRIFWLFLSSLLKDLENRLVYRYAVSVFCSVCCHTLSCRPALPVSSGATTKGRFPMCGLVSLGFKRSVYTMCWARSCEATVSKRVVGHRFLGALSISIVRRWDDSTQSLAQGSFRFGLVYLFYPLYEDLGSDDLFWDVLVLFSYITRLIMRAVNPRNGTVTYSRYLAVWKM